MKETENNPEVPVEMIEENPHLVASALREAAKRYEKVVGNGLSELEPSDIQTLRDLAYEVDRLKGANIPDIEGSIPENRECDQGI